MPKNKQERLEGGSVAMGFLLRTDEALFTLEKFLCVVLGVSMFGATFIETLLRYGFGTTLLVGISDLIKWGFVWFAVMGCAALVKRNAHINVDVFVQRFPEQLRRYLRILSDALLLVFFACAIKSGYVFAFSQWTIAATAVDVPKTFLYLSIPVGMSLMFYHITVQMIRAVRTPQKDGINLMEAGR
ncbi:MAG: TRAP transporter small permease [Deltaproteobacteria bacterium]|nr:TRAP transporter small permease [Deltaproteobacteria bacterium]